MQINKIEDIKEIEGKTFVIRVDFNVPLNDKGEIEDDTRIKAELKTIEYIKNKGGKIVLITHLGRPKGEVKNNLKLDNIAKHLEKLINTPVNKLDSITGPDVEKEIKSMKNGEITMLENVRFDKREKECNEEFSKELANLGDTYINDAFATAHRKHASTAGIAKYIPAYAGFLMEKEINALSPIIEEEQERPITMIFGGAKIETKIKLIKNFLNKADYFLIGGAIANTFLAGAGYNIAKSKYEKDELETAREIMLNCEKFKEKFILPHDVVVADEIKENAKTANIPIEDVEGDMMILDIGKWSAEKFGNIISESKTVIWNGPVGLYENKAFSEGTKTIGKVLAETDCTSIVGGGDTADAIKKLGIDETKFTHLSTGGGAAIEFLSGKKLPGIEILKK